MNGERDIDSVEETSRIMKRALIFAIVSLAAFGDIGCVAAGGGFPGQRGPVGGIGGMPGIGGASRGGNFPSSGSGLGGGG